MTSKTVVEIVPGKSIGPVHLGARQEDLPSRATLDFPAGKLDGVSFLLDDNHRVEDVWIEDLRGFSGSVSLRGQRLDSGITLEDLERTFGKCERVAGVKGGIFYNCAVGLAIGTDLERRKLQIRVKHR